MDTLTIAILAAGLSSRYGAAKFLVPVGPDGETLLDYAVYDALASGFGVADLASTARPESTRIK